MIVPAARLYAIAYTRYALGHFNVAHMEQILGVFRGACEAEAPFILAFTPSARRYATARMLEQMTIAARDLFPDAIFAVHLDHGDEASCDEAIHSGVYSSVMIDGSHLSFEDNIAVTRRVVERAHDRGLSVEAELGVIAGKEGHLDVGRRQALFTDPDQAAEFVARSGCDSLAVAVGTQHGAYKFAAEEGLRLDRLAEIQQRLPHFPLVLHGASSVNLEDVRRINAAGGQLKGDAKGVDESVFPAAIRLGVTKVNIATDARLLWTRVQREFFRDRPGAFDPAEPGQIYMQELAQLVLHKCKVLGSEGQLARVRSAVTGSDAT